MAKKYIAMVVNRSTKEIVKVSKPDVLKVIAITAIAWSVGLDYLDYEVVIDMAVGLVQLLG